VEGDPPGRGKFEDSAARIVLRSFGIEDELIPLNSVVVSSPDALESLSRAIAEFGMSKLKEFFDILNAKGLTIKAYSGGGSWGHVFCLHSSATSSLVALKLLKPPYSTEWSNRFQREIEILRKLSGNSGIANVIGNLQVDAGLQYYIQEFIEGVPLSSLRLPQTPTYAIFLVKKILKALSAAHANRIIHRDLHLGNVILSNHGFGFDESVHIVDFGLARDETAIEYYKTFKPVGAMTTCALEKWKDPSAAGTQSDIFSVGVVLYKLLTGQFPFWAETYIELYEKIKSGRYEKPSSIQVNVPPFLDILTQEFLYPESTRRPIDADDAIRLLDDFEPIIKLWEKQTHYR
jgi:serine/threonine-protein kinase